MKCRLLLLLGILTLSFSKIQAEPLEPVQIPSLVSSLEFDTTLNFCGERVPTEAQEIRERLEKELMLSLWNRPQVILWLKRSSRYLPYIEGLLRNNEMPDDLKYVAIAESALRPHAVSKKGAVGFWQFMQHTGRKYGLVIDSRVDERRNIFASTRAAIGYFQDLHAVFGSWTLAAAAFNMGEERLMTEILEQGINDYYRLYLFLETQRYIFRIISIKMILNDPQKYGFYLSEEDYYPPPRFEQIQVDCRDETPIRIIAQAANTHFKVIKDLNPEIRGYYLPEGTHTVLIPELSSKGFLGRYQDLVKRWAARDRQRTYIVKAGDHLTSIADRFEVPLASLIIWNRLDPRAPIHPGDRLIIYRQEPRAVAADNDENDGDESGRGNQ
jgi:hypothetical protein